MSSVKDANSIITMHTRLWRKTREKWMSYQMGSDFSAEIFMNVCIIIYAHCNIYMYCPLLRELFPYFTDICMLATG